MNLKAEVYKLKNAIEKLGKKRAGKSTMTEELRIWLKDRGYVEEYLGTGNSAYITSCDIKEMDIKSRKYLKGKYLVVGLSNIKNGKGNIYRGLVKSI